MLFDFRWRVVADQDTGVKCTALLGLVRLRTPLLLPTFIRFGIAIERQLARTSGVLGFRTAAAPLTLTFYHLSAWRDRSAIDVFVRTDPHLVAMQQLSGRLGVTSFQYWEVASSELPLQMRPELSRFFQL